MHSNIFTARVTTIRDSDYEYKEPKAELVHEEAMQYPFYADYIEPRNKNARNGPFLLLFGKQGQHKQFNVSDNGYRVDLIDPKKATEAWLKAKFKTTKEMLERFKYENFMNEGRPDAYELIQTLSGNTGNIFVTNTLGYTRLRTPTEFMKMCHWLPGHSTITIQRVYSYHF